MSLTFFAYISDGFELLLLVFLGTLRGEISYLRGWIVDFCLASRLVTTILGLATAIVDLFLLGSMVPGADVFLEVDSYSFLIEFFTLLGSFCQLGNFLQQRFSFSLLRHLVSTRENAQLKTNEEGKKGKGHLLSLFRYKN